MFTHKFVHIIATAFFMLVFFSGCSKEISVQVQPQEIAQLSNKENPINRSVASQNSDDKKQDEVSVWAGSLLPGVIDGSHDKAQFIKPYGLCAAPDGGILVVDCYANLLRSCRDEKVLTLAGSVDTLDLGGFPLGGYLNGESKEAFLNHPRFAITTQEGSVIFSDTDNHRVRILHEGNVRLLAGDGTAGYKDGNYKTAQFNIPSGVAVDFDGTIYVADTLNHCIRAISPKGEVSTLAGKPQQDGLRDGALSEALFCEPNDIQLGSDGALYIVDKGNQRIRKIMNDKVTTIAGSGDAKDATTGYVIGGYQDGKTDQALFQYPTGLFVTEDNIIYVADTGNNCIRSILPSGEVTTVAGTKMPGNVSGSREKARFNQPIDVFYRDGRLYISDSYNHAIRLVELGGSKEGKGGT